MSAVSLLHPIVLAFAGVAFIVAAGVVAYIQAYPERSPWVVRGYWAIRPRWPFAIGLTLLLASVLSAC